MIPCQIEYGTQAIEFAIVRRLFHPPERRPEVEFVG